MLRLFQHGPILIFAIVINGTFFGLVGAQESGAENTHKYERSIGDIGKKIEKIRRNLNANKALVASQRDKLLDAEQKLYKLSQSLEKTSYDLAKNQHEYDALKLQIAKVKESQRSNKEALIGLLKSRYYQGKPEFLKKLLNQENPYAVGRLANYQKYFSSALKDRYALLSQQARELEKLDLKQSAIISVLSDEREQQKKLHGEYKKSQQLRAQTIAKLDQKISTNAQTLEKLRNDRKRLKSLLKQLKKQAAELRRLDQIKAKAEAQRRKAKATKPEVDKAAKPVQRLAVKGGFLKQKGRLAYPVTGKLIRSFGSRLPESGMRSEGSFFSTLGPVSVSSIFRGRVLFADFLKGYGLLIIVDHGDDHISLYGHNDRLLKKVGDKVDTNEVIAKSGVTGGLKSHGLYFEIRNNATPIDASKWCR